MGVIILPDLLWLNHILKDTFPIYVAKCCFFLTSSFNFLIILHSISQNRLLTLLIFVYIGNNCIGVSAVNIFSSQGYLSVCLSTIGKHSFVKGFEQFSTTCC